MEIKSTKDIKLDKANILVYGKSGAGKTTLAGTLTGKTIIVSFENGLLSLQGKSVDFLEYDSKDGDRYTWMQKAFKMVAESDYENVVVDSLTEVADVLLEVATKEFPAQNQVMPRYGKYNVLMNQFLRYTRNTDKNIIYLCLEKEEKDQIGRTTYLPDIAGSIAKKCNALFDFVAHYQIIEKDDVAHRVLCMEAQPYNIAKDRTGKLNACEKPDLQNIFNKINGVEPMKGE